MHQAHPVAVHEACCEMWILLAAVRGGLAAVDHSVPPPARSHLFPSFFEFIAVRSTQGDIFKGHWQLAPCGNWRKVQRRPLEGIQWNSLISKAGWDQKGPTLHGRPQAPLPTYSRNHGKEIMEQTGDKMEAGPLLWSLIKANWSAICGLATAYPNGKDNS